MERPLVTVSIPTRNSGAFLGRCLDAIDEQTYRRIEVHVVDGHSTDETREIAARRGLSVYEDKQGLLSARKIGMEKARGDFVLLLDSDQILEPDAIERAVATVEEASVDMLVLEEDVYSSRTWLEKLFQLDRSLIHTVGDFSPYSGVMLPRFYRRALLARAFGNIPVEALRAGGQDHAIIYFEAWQLSQRVTLLPRAVRHIEPGTLREMLPKFYRWGATSVSAHHERYHELLSSKERFRKGLFRRGLVLASLGSVALLILKGAPYYLGYIVRRAKGH